MTNSFSFEGILMPSFHTSVEALSFAQDEFLVRDDDIILVTYPRSGTHWMIEILSLIISNGNLRWVQSFAPSARCPWIESKNFQKCIVDQIGQRLMTTHLPIQLFPKSSFSSTPKIIYVIRNPRDVATSSYHITKLMPNHKKPFDFVHYLNRFIQGDVFYGSWFDHIHGWMKKRDTGCFLLMSYEALQRDLRASVQKICRFLGKNLEPAETDSVLQNSSFPAMKDNGVSTYLTMGNPHDGTITKIPILRKGISGDWKNLFTVAQSEAFDKVYWEKMSDLDPGLFPWS